MRVIFFGTHCLFSCAPFRILAESGHTVCAVIVPADDLPDGQALAPLVAPSLEPIPLTPTDEEASLVSLAWMQHIPVWQVRQLAAPETLATLAAWQADVACVSCFPRRIPATLLRIPRHGFFNVHPSLLPAYRGPHPLFWMFRQGEITFGVTIHFMDEQWDTGDIVAQAEVTLPDGVSGEEADLVLSEDGGELLVEVLHHLEQGTLTRRSQSSQGAQNAPGGQYYPTPAAKDFEIDPAWTAQRAFNFMRGTAEWGRLYPIELAGQRWLLRHASFYADDEVLGAPYRLLGDQIDLQFARGVLRAAVAGQLLRESAK